MERQQTETAPHRALNKKKAEPPAKDYPVREYIAGMTQELAQMARWDGDDILAGMLDAAASRAEGARP
jgi:hypothetical protein